MIVASSDLALLRLLRLGAGACFLGWAWQHFYWEGPYGVLLWQPAALDVATELGGDWDAFVGSGTEPGWVQRLVAWMAWPYLIGAVLAFTATRRAWFQLTGLVLANCCLAILAYAKYVDDLRQFPTLIEYGGQVLSPVLVVLALRLGARHRLTVAIAVAALLTTFFGHGALALGLWRTPTNFHGMTVVILGLDHGAATGFLRVMGALDLVVCVGILVPAVRRSCALYAVAWGLLTALARPVAGMAVGLNYWGADQYLHEAVLRAPHWLIPLFLFMLWQRPREPLGVAPSVASARAPGAVSS